MRKIITLVIAIALLFCMVQPVFETIPTDIITKFNNQDNWGKMKAENSSDGSFDRVEYYA